MTTIIDSHTHIFSKEVCDGRDKFFHDSSFAMLYNGKKVICAGVEDLIADMDIHNVAQSWTLSFPWKKEKDCARENAFLIESAATYPGRLIPFASVAIEGSGNIKETIRICAREGFTGIGEIALYDTGFGSGQIKYLSAILEGCAEEGLIVVIHVNEPVGHRYIGKYFTDFSILCEILDTFDTVGCILSHWGGGLLFYELMPEIRKALSHVMYDTAASPFLYKDDIYKIAVDCVGSEKILFGSDYPILHSDRYKTEINTLPVADAENILFGNARRITEK
jgi:predicted TIM-barrel fold metal-dependent hydrolase